MIGWMEHTGIPLSYRDDKWDMMKGIGIILMVLGHSGVPNSIHDFIYLFHMGLFFFGSDCFLKLPKNYEEIKRHQDYYVFIKKKLKAFWFTFVKFGIQLRKYNEFLWPLHY